MSSYECKLCSHIYDAKTEGIQWQQLGDDWECPMCGSPKSLFNNISQDDESAEDEPAKQPNTSELDLSNSEQEYLKQFKRSSDPIETQMQTIHQMAETGESVIEPMRAQMPMMSWDDILIAGGQLAKLPLNDDEDVNTKTIIGKTAKKPLVMDTPLFISHMSFGALSKQAKLALAKGSAAVGAAICSGEGGILPEELEAAHKYILEYVPNKYSITEEYLRKVDAVEIKIGQSAKPGMGGHLPAKKVTEEIAKVRNRPEGQDIISPARFSDINNKDELKQAIDMLREKSGGKPIGVKIAAGHIEEDIEFVLYAKPDFITIDGRAGATGAAIKNIKIATSIPTVFALWRAKQALDKFGAKDIALIITGNLRVSSDFAKALALGADAIALASSALMAIGCQQYRICHTGNCPIGITSHDPNLTARLNVEKSAKRLENFMRVSNEELKHFARLTGNNDIHSLSIKDLYTTNSEISNHTAIKHV